MDNDWSALEKAYEESPIHNAFGLHLTITAPGVAEIRSEAAPSRVNLYGVVAGGVLATMIDSAIVQACRSRLARGDKVTTLELKVNFMRALPTDRAVRAVGSLEHLGRTTAVGLARVVDEQGTSYAAGMATISVRRTS